MDPLVTGSLIAAGGGILSSVFGNDAARQRQKEAFNQQVQLWNMNNEYNKPTAQKQRLLDAGINPYMAMTGDTGSSMASAPAPAGVDMSGFNQAAQSVGDFFAREQQHQIDKDLGEADTRLKNSQADSQDIANKTSAFEAFVRIGKMISETKDIDTKRKYQEIQNDIAKAVQSDVIESYHLQNKATEADINLKTVEATAYDLQNMFAQIHLKYADAEFASQIALNFANAMSARAGANLSYSQAKLVAKQIVTEEARAKGLKISNTQSEKISTFLVDKAKADAKRATEEAENVELFGIPNPSSTYDQNFGIGGKYGVGVSGSYYESIGESKRNARNVRDSRK